MMMTNNDILSDIVWVESERPKTIADCILPKETEKNIKALVKKKEIPSMIFYGSPGVGKTSVALAICNELGYEVLMINGSNEGRLIDTLRNKITNFASSISVFGNKKCVIIDEADYLPEELIQPAMRNFIEEFARVGVVFIFTCNSISRIIDPLKSRCALIDFSVRKEDAMDMKIKLIKRVQDILIKKGVTVENDTILPLMVKKYFPDMRRLLNELQFRSGSGVLDSSALSTKSASNIDELVSLLKGKSIKSVREWIATEPYIDVGSVTKELYNRMYDICVDGNSMADFIAIIADWNYKSAFMTDTEIALMAMFVEMMNDVDFKE